MTDWASGYVAKIDQTCGYYQELSLALAMLNKCLATRGGQPRRYLALGFGQGGIWSWISDENCVILVHIVRRTLAVGGL